MFVLNVPIEDLFSSSDFIRLSKRSHGKHTHTVLNTTPLPSVIILKCSTFHYLIKTNPMLFFLKNLLL